MTKASRRAALTMGLGLGGINLLAQSGPAAAPPPKDEPKPDGPAPVGGLKIGTVNVGTVYKGFEKTKTQAEKLKADAVVRQREFAKMEDKNKREAEALKAEVLKKGLGPDSPAYDEVQLRISKIDRELLSARLKAGSESSQKEAEMLLQLYHEIQKAIAFIAKQRGMAFVLRITDVMPAGKEPKETEVYEIIERAVVYADPSTDITPEVLTLLNHG